MKKILSVFLSLLSLPMLADNLLPSKCEAFLPRELSRAIVYQSYVDRLPINDYGQKEPSTLKYWDAYSDRSNNVAYNGPSISSGYTGVELSFNQKVRIAKIENGFAWVYIENKPHRVNYPDLSSDCSPVGWIPMDNLLLWSRCPADKNGFQQTAWMMVDIDSLQENRDKGILHFCVNPITKDSLQNVCSDMQFYFVMKQIENGMALLAKGDLNGYNPQGQLYGWVDKGAIIPCNQRVFLEPNWDPEVAESLVGKFAYVYHNDEIAAAIPYGMENGITDNPKMKYRREPEVMRFPVVEKSDGADNQYHIIAFVSTGVPEISNAPLSVFGTSRGVVPLKNALMAFQGTVDKKDSHTGLDYWKPVVLLSSDELVELIHKFEPLKATVKVNTYGTKERANYVKAITDVIQSITGRNAEEIENLSTDEINRIIEGLYYVTPVIKEQINGKNYTLSDIKNPSVCPDVEFKMIVKRMETRIEDLGLIPRSPKFRFSFIQNGVKWFWIPLEMIP